MVLGLVRRAHGGLVRDRRRDVLARVIAELLPEAGQVADVGCGDGAITARVGALRPQLTILGLEVEARPEAELPVTLFDGRTLPLGDRSVDYSLFVDVLHHTTDAERLLREARRVSRRGVLIKDHLAASSTARALLTFMDLVGNPASVAQPRCYLSEPGWRALWARVGLAPARQLVRRLDLYRRPLTYLFDRRLHFVALLERR